MPEPTCAANAVVGKGTCRQVNTLEDVRAALTRVRQDERLVALTKHALVSPQAGVFLWGVRGLAVMEIMTTQLDGTFAYVSWLQNEHGYSIKRDILPVMMFWAEQYGIGRLVASVDREGPWTRLTGMRPWKLLLSLEF